MFAPFDVGLRFVLDDDFESDAFIQLGIVLYQEVFEVIECYVDVFVGVLHVLVQSAHQLVEHDRAFFVELSQLIIDIVHELLRQVFRMRFTKLDHE